MTKVLDATCVDGKITIEGQEVEGEVLSAGVAESEGQAILEGSKVVYIANTVSDLELLIEKVAESLTKIANTLTSIGAGMTGPTTAPPPTLAMAVAEITAISTELTELKDNLK